MSYTAAEIEAMERWSIVVRHAHKDDLGSDADSVEIISEDSDEDTTDYGKESSDDGTASRASLDRTTPKSKDQRYRSSDKQRLGNQTSTLSDKLDDFFVGNKSSMSREEVEVRYIMVTCLLVSLICSLIVPSYILYTKMNNILPDSGDDHITSVRALQETDQVISKVRKVLSLENEQHLQEILSKMPADSLTSGGLINMVPHLPRQMSDYTDSTPEGDVKTVLSSDYAIGAETVQNRGNIGRDSFDEEVKHRNPVVPKQNDQDMKNPYLDDSKINPPRPPNSKTPTTLQDHPQEISSQGHEKLQERYFSDSTDPKITTTNAVQGSTRNGSTEAANSITRKSTRESPTQNETSSNQASHIERILLSVRQDVISIQKDIYSKIINSLLEYKIELYKNLLRAGLNISCPDLSTKKSNHKNFMLIRSLQQIIAKSSESNFESWYKFYSYSMFPKISEAVGKIDSITKDSDGYEFDPRIQRGKKANKVGDLWAKNVNDDFFIRAGDPHIAPAVTVETAARGGFDWNNLDKKIRESMRNALKHGRPKNSDTDGYIREGKHKGDEEKQQQFVEVDQDSIHKKDRDDKNNLKGDFRKRKISEHEHKKHFKHQEKTQNHQQAEYEHHRSDLKRGKHGHDRTDYKQERHVRDRRNQKREGYENNDNKPGKHEQYEKSNKHGKSKHEEHGKKYNIVENERQDEHERQYKKYDQSKSYNPKESKQNQERHDKQTFRESASYSYDEDVQNYNDYNDRKAKSNSGRNHESREYKKDFKSKQDKFEYDRNYRESEEFGGQYNNEKTRKKISFIDIEKYVKNTAFGLWKTMKEGYKNAKDYGKNYINDWRSQKPKETGKYEEWRKEFVKEMKDVIRVLGGNPALASLSEVPKSVSKFLVDGLGRIVGSFSDEGEEKREMGPEGLRPGPEGLKEEACFPGGICLNEANGDDEQASEGYTTDEGYESEGQKSETPYSDAPNHRGTEPTGRNTGSWYYDAAKHRADARRHPGYPRVSDSSWFLGLGRHRAYLRRRGIHLDDDGSWFISSAKHRAKMRQRHLESPKSPYFYSQASSKR